MDYLELYNTNKKFHEYVDKEMRTYGYTLEEALKILIIRNVGDYYSSNEKDDRTLVTRKAFGCSCETEDKAC